VACGTSKGVEGQMFTPFRARFLHVFGVTCIALLLVFSNGAFLAAQTPPPPEEGTAGPPRQQLAPQQLDSLVAPVALYPDRLLGQILVAATYPLEVAEADQWLQQNRNLQGAQLVDAARQQNWDPSVQALVVFPDVLDRLASDIRWTTDLGNAFLAQQADVMNAVQRLRSQAMASGKLQSNQYENVETQAQGDQSAIEIQPANPEEVYVPEYNPEYVWGPDYDYPPLDYPDYGFAWYPGVYVGGFFGGLAWNNWGWWPNWFGCNVFVNGYFFDHWGFGRGYGGWGHGGWGGRRWGNGWSAWSHDPGHRLGVPYSSRSLSSRFHGSYGAGGSYGRAVASGGGAYAGRAQTGGWNRFGRSGGAGTAFAGSRGTAGGQWNRFGSGGYQSGYRGGQSFAGNSGNRANSGYYRGNSSYNGARNYSARPSVGGGYRMNQSYAGGGYRGSVGGAYRSNQSFAGGGGYRSYGGGHFAQSYRSAPSSGGYRGGNAFRGGGGGGFHGGGGGGFHGGGGGGHGGRR